MAYDKSVEFAKRIRALIENAEAAFDALEYHKTPIPINTAEAYIKFRKALTEFYKLDSMYLRFLQEGQETIIGVIKGKP